MDSNTHHDSTPDALSSRVLLVADWSVDPQAVVAACQRRSEQQACTFGLVVPAWLHGLDWVGDPLASVPCARRQLADITVLADAAGLTIDYAGVGDPEPVTAMCDALANRPADELLLCARASRVSVGHPLDLTHRAQRVTGLPVQRINVPAAATESAGKRMRLRHRHCGLEQPQPA
jgi:hypothetical protein